MLLLQTQGQLKGYEYSYYNYKFYYPILDETFLVEEEDDKVLMVV